MRARRADDLEMAEFLGADIHENVFSRSVIAVEPLNGVLHRRSEFAVSAAELFEEHVAEPRIGLVHTNGVHELLDVMVHAASRLE